MPDMRATPIVYQGQQPAAAPFPKVVYSGITSAFGNNIYGIRRVSYVAQAGTTDQVIISPNGTCSNGLATPQSFVLAFGTQQAVDSYGLNILGGPAEPEPGNIFTQAVGTSSTRVVLGFKTTKGKGGRKLPWISGIQQGDGVTEDLYGTYDYITPDGVVHTAPGPKDKIVNTPRVRVKLAMSGMTDISYLKFTGDPDPIYQNKGLAADIDKIKAAIGTGSGTAYKSGFGTEINGVTPPTGVTLALATGTDLGIGLYDYLFTKRTSTHKESGPSAPLSITTTTGNQDVTITLPALDPVNDPLTIGYSIYRSAVGGTGTPISQCGGVTSTVDGTGKTTYQYQIPASYLLSYDPSVLATPGTPPLPIDPATGLACTFDSGTGLFMSGGSAFDATLPQTYTSGQGYTWVADNGAGTYTDTSSDASITSNKRPPGDNTPEIDTLLATVDETLGSLLDAGLINTGPSGGLLPLGRGLKTNLHISGGTPDSALEIVDNMLRTRVDAQSIVIDPTNNWIQANVDGFRAMAFDSSGIYVKVDGTTVSYDGDGNLVTIDDDGPTCCACTPTTAPRAPTSRGNVDCSGFTPGDGGICQGAYDAGATDFSAPTISNQVHLFAQQYLFKTSGTWGPPMGVAGGGDASDTTAMPFWYGPHDVDPIWAPHISQRRILYAYLDISDPAQHTIFTNYLSHCGSSGATTAGTAFIDYTPIIPAANWHIIVPDAPFTGLYNPLSLTHWWGEWVTWDPAISIPFPVVDAWDSTALGPAPVAGAALDSSATGMGCYSTVNTIVGELKAGSALFAGAVTAASVTLTGTSTLINYGRSDHRAMTAPATPASGYTSLYSKTVSGTTKLFYKDDAGTEYDLSASSGGTVTSVGLSLPAIFNVTVSPVTGSGTLTATLANETANTVFAGPTSGGAAAPTFRGLAAADLPLATTSAVGAVEVGENLQVTGAGLLKAPAWSLLTDGASSLVFAGGDVIDIESF